MRSKTKSRMNKMTMIKVLIPFMLINTLIHAEPSEDQDMDGVPDSIDQCLDTPFLTEVDSRGCATRELIFPQERDNGSLDIVLGYGYSNNDDTISREEQHVTRLQASYIYNDWIYTLRSAYFHTGDENGMLDTIFKVKKRFKPVKNFKFAIGAGVRLPTYDFEGNRADYTLYSSAIYYPVSAVSLFGGANYTFVNDRETDSPLQDITALYIGTGYFFTKAFYINASYSYSDTKFADYHKIKTVSSTIFYQFNEKWHASFTYSHELDDDDLHDTFSFRIGYSVW